MTDEDAMGRLWPVAMTLALLFVPASFGLAIQNRNADDRFTQRELSAAVEAAHDDLVTHFDRVRALALTGAQSASVQTLMASPRASVPTRRSNRATLRATHRAMAFLVALYPSGIAQVSLLDRDGREVARVARGPACRTAGGEHPA